MCACARVCVGNTVNIIDITFLCVCLCCFAWGWRAVRRILRAEGGGACLCRQSAVYYLCECDFHLIVRNYVCAVNTMGGAAVAGRIIAMIAATATATLVMRYLWWSVAR